MATDKVGLTGLNSIPSSPLSACIEVGAKLPCLAARPTKDGRPYPRYLGQHVVLSLPRGQ